MGNLTTTIFSSKKQVFAVCVVCVFAMFLSAASMAQKKQNRNGKTTDFSGYWEMDYSDSDNIQARLDSMVRELQRRAQRKADNNGNTRSNATLGSASGVYNSGPSIVGLARMADAITQSQLLEIEQTENEIDIKREATFALSCEFYGDNFHTVETPFGKESCGWDSHQLLFRIRLPEGLSIQHRFTLGPARERLNVATTLVSDRVSYPFTLNRVYNRYDPGKSGISCALTLTRGKVCTTESLQ